MRKEKNTGFSIPLEDITGQKEKNSGIDSIIPTRYLDEAGRRSKKLVDEEKI